MQSRSANKKKILYLCPRVPYPPTYGYPIRALNVGKILSSKYGVDLLAIAPSGRGKKWVSELRKTFGKVILFEKKPHQFFINTVLGVFRRCPIQASCYYFDDVRRWVDTHSSEYDLILCSTIRMAEYALHQDSVKRAVDLIDAISLHYKVATHFRRNLLWQVIYLLESRRLLPYERKVARESDLAFITSHFDGRYIAGNSGKLHGKILAVPNGVNASYLKRDRRGALASDYLMFLGKMNYGPNEDAAVWFAHKVWPELRSRYRELRFLIVGRDPSRQVRRLERVSGVEVIGFVDDPKFFMEQAKLVVVPLRFGAGIQNKVLEAMALGKAVVTTPIGVRGIPEAINEADLVIADNQAKMVERIVELLDDGEGCRRLGVNARALVGKRYTWERVGERLLNCVGHLLD